MMDGPPISVVLFKAAALAALGLYLTHLLTAGTDEIVAGPPHEAPPSFSSPTPREVTTERLLDSGECWVGRQPPGVYPTSVLVAGVRDGRPTAERRTDLLGPALDQVFKGVDGGLDIIAFCR